MGKFGEPHRENLKNWPKGVSGNPNGRPKTKIIREYARKIAEEKSEDGKMLVAEELVRLLLKYARKGSLGHQQQLHNLIECDAGTAGGDGTALDTDAINRLVNKLLR